MNDRVLKPLDSMNNLGLWMTSMILDRELKAQAAMKQSGLWLT